MKKQKKDHWQSIFEQQKNSGLSIIQFCRNNNVNTSTFYAWRKRLSGEILLDKPPQQVIPLIINEQAFTQSMMIKITTPEGYQVEFDSTLSTQVLAPLLKVL